MNQYRLKKLSEVLDSFERNVKFETGVKFISGGFAHADMMSFTDTDVSIRMRWGVQSDAAYTMNEEDWKLEITQLDEDDVNDIVENIREA